MNVGCLETGLFGVWASLHWLNRILGFLKLAKLECIQNIGRSHVLLVFIIFI
jgi:hypothetical protein